MKILLAIVTDNWKQLSDGDHALRWAGRLGYEKRIFVPKNKRSKFMSGIDDLNYHYYLNLQYDMLVGRTTAMEYAKQHEFDLLLTIPEDLKEWRKGSSYKDREIVHAVKSIGNARIIFGKDPERLVYTWGNGAKMERVV